MGLKEERRAQRKEQVEKIKASYTSHEEISLTSKWKDVQELLKDEETYKWLSKLEALTSWEEWVTESEKKEVEVKGKAKFRHERLTRDGFRDLMRDCLKEGELKLTSVWKDFAKTATKEDRYLAMIGMSGSTPHELFDDFLEELNDKYKDDRAKIKKFAKAAGVVVTSNSTYEEFHEKLKGEKEHLEMPKEHRVGVFDSLFSKAKEQDENAEKNAKKNRKRFVELLQKSRDSHTAFPTNRPPSCWVRPPPGSPWTTQRGGNVLTSSWTSSRSRASPGSRSLPPTTVRSRRLRSPRKR